MGEYLEKRNFFLHLNGTLHFTKYICIKLWFSKSWADIIILILLNGK